MRRLHSQIGWLFARFELCCRCASWTPRIDNMLEGLLTKSGLPGVLVAGQQEARSRKLIESKSTFAEDKFGCFGRPS